MDWLGIGCVVAVVLLFWFKLSRHERLLDRTRDMISNQGGAFLVLENCLRDAGLIGSPKTPNEEQGKNLGVAIMALWGDLSTWSQATFGTDAERSPAGAFEHLRLEVEELRQAYERSVESLYAYTNNGIKHGPSHLHALVIEEWADCFMLLLDIARRSGFTFAMGVQATQQKLAFNKTQKFVKLEGTQIMTREKPKDIETGIELLDEFGNVVPSQLAWSELGNATIPPEAQVALDVFGNTPISSEILKAFDYTKEHRTCAQMAIGGDLGCGGSSSHWVKTAPDAIETVRLRGRGTTVRVLAAVRRYQCPCQRRWSFCYITPPQQYGMDEALGQCFDPVTTEWCDTEEVMEVVPEPRVKDDLRIVHTGPGPAGGACLGVAEIGKGWESPLAAAARGIKVQEVTKEEVAALRAAAPDLDTKQLAQALLYAAKEKDSRVIRVELEPTAHSPMRRFRDGWPASAVLTPGFQMCPTCGGRGAYMGGDGDECNTCDGKGEIPNPNETPVDLERLRGLTTDSIEQIILKDYSQRLGELQAKEQLKDVAKIIDGDPDAPEPRGVLLANHSPQQIADVDHEGYMVGPDGKRVLLLGLPMKVDPNLPVSDYANLDMVRVVQHELGHTIAMPEIAVGQVDAEKLAKDVKELYRGVEPSPVITIPTATESGKPKRQRARFDGQRTVAKDSAHAALLSRATIINEYLDQGTLIVGNDDPDARLGRWHEIDEVRAVNYEKGCMVAVVKVGGQVTKSVNVYATKVKTDLQEL